MVEQQGKLVRKTDIPVSVGKPSAEENRKWLHQQVVYKNHAGLHDHLDQKVAAFVENHRSQFYARMDSVMERWMTVWDAANGNPMWAEHEDDIHVPETKKKLDAKVARIEEALFEFDPIFEAEGVRGDLPQWKATIITSYIYRMMELAGYRELVQPGARDQEICNIGAIKLRWNTTISQAVDRTWEMRELANGKTYWHDERRLRDDVATSGIQYSMVDPFMFLYDIDCNDLNGDECAFVGDESNQFVHDLEAQAKIGELSQKNMKLVRDRNAGATTNPHAATAGGDLQDQRRMARSIAQGPTYVQDVNGDHDPRRVRCVEMWAWFDFGDGFDGVVDPLGRRITGTHKVVITMAAGVVVQFRLNPYDRKCHPYAIGRINRNGHESVAPAPFEQVIQVNAQYDRFQSNVLRHSDLSVAPMLRSAGEFETDSLLAVKAGHVFRNSGEVQQINIGDLPQSVSYMHQFFRREMEESSGALNVFESPQGTATETERKVQEQQRMVRTSIRANAEMWRQVAIKTYWLCAQFSTGPQRFSVVGKASSILGKSFEITPDVMQSDIDIRFLGLDSLHVFGNRVAGMAQWMGRWGPLLPSIPTVNLMALCRQDFELTVGRHNVNEVFPMPEPAWSTWPQSSENEMLLAGRSVPVSQSDNDDEHLKQLEPLIRNIKKYPQYVQTAVRDHANGHMEARAKKAAEREAQQKKAMAEQMMLGGRPGIDKPPAQGGMPAPSKAQQPGVAPGPTDARTTAKPGRGQAVSQQQAMSA